MRDGGDDPSLRDCVRRLDAIEEAAVWNRTHLSVEQLDEMEKRFMSRHELERAYIPRAELDRRHSDGRDWTVRLIGTLIAVGQLVEAYVLARGHH